MPSDESFDAAAGELDLAGVEPAADTDPELAKTVPDRACAANRTRRSVECGQRRVALDRVDDVEQGDGRRRS